MNQNEFLRMLGESNNNGKSKTAKADWDTITAKAAEDGIGYTITQFHEIAVDGVVSKGRVRGKLDDLFKKKKVARVTSSNGAYIYCFGASAIEAQHGK